MKCRTIKNRGSSHPSGTLELMMEPKVISLSFSSCCLYVKQTASINPCSVALVTSATLNDCGDKLIITHIPHHFKLIIKVFTLHNLQKWFQLLLQPFGLLARQHQSQSHVGPLDLHGLFQLPDDLQSLQTKGHLATMNRRLKNNIRKMHHCRGLSESS